MRISYKKFWIVVTISTLCIIIVLLWFLHFSENIPQLSKICPKSLLDKPKLKNNTYSKSILKKIDDNLKKLATKIDRVQAEPKKLTKGTGKIAEINKKHPKYFENFLKMEFVYIPPGSFTMGTYFDNKDKDEKPHIVELTEGFYMQTSEVTQGQWKAVMNNNPSYYSRCGDNCPVERVSWFDIQKFIKKLNKQDNFHNYSLPTEAQWEYAAKAETTSQFYWGDRPDCSKANFGNSAKIQECIDNPGKTMKTKSYEANKWGLFDMHGNVSEWCLDCYAEYSVKNPVNPTVNNLSKSLNLKKARKVVRGGAYNDKTIHCRSSNRMRMNPYKKNISTGFRLIISQDIFKTVPTSSPEYKKLTVPINKNTLLSPFSTYENRYQVIFKKLKEAKMDEKRIYEIFSSKRAKQIDKRSISRMSKKVVSTLSKKNNRQTKNNVKKIVKHLKKFNKYYDYLEQKFTVNREIAAAILFKETTLGEFKNWKHESFTTLNSILGFMKLSDKNYQNKRIKRIISTAQDSLVELLLYCDKYKIDILEKKFPSSYAGAIGVVQFLPVYLSYAISSDNTIPDLSKIPDGILSLGNIFTLKFNWPGYMNLDRLNNIDEIVKKYFKYDEQTKGASLCNNFDLDDNPLKSFSDEFKNIPNIDYICKYSRSIMNYNFSSVYALDVLQLAFYTQKKRSVYR